MTVSKKSVAYHEAGHAVVANYLGFPFNGCSLRNVVRYDLYYIEFKQLFFVEAVSS